MEHVVTNKDLSVPKTMKAWVLDDPEQLRPLNRPTTV